MSLDYACIFASETLRTPVRSVRNGIRIFAAPVDFEDKTFCLALLKKKELFQKAASGPLIFSIERHFSYALLHLKHDDLLIGPVRFDAPVFCQNNFTIKDLKLPPFPSSFNKDYWLKSVPLCSLDDFAGILVLLTNLERDNSLSCPYIRKNEVVQNNCLDQEALTNARTELSDMMFKRVENGIVHNPINHELRETHCVQTGDIEGLRKVVNEEFSGRYGKLAFDSLRQERNIGIVTITLASRAAIRGGLHFETAFSISDVFIQQMEKCNDVETIRSIYRSAESYYCSLVRDLQQGQPQQSVSAPDFSRSQTDRSMLYDPQNLPLTSEDIRIKQKEKKGQKKDTPVIVNRHISHCKDYIFSHLHGKITVRQIADAIGLDANYLSALFHKEEHQTLKSYITHEKVNLIKNLLTYSTYSYADIAAYLGFSSQSHMAREFKKEVGISPRQYREAFQRDDFIKESLDE